MKTLRVQLAGIQPKPLLKKGYSKGPRPQTGNQKIAMQRPELRTPQPQEALSP